MTVNSLLRQFLLAIALFGVIAGGVVHAKTASHDSAECTICLHSPLSDLHNTQSINLIHRKAVSFSLRQHTLQNPVVSTVSYSFNTRAPPIK